MVRLKDLPPYLLEGLIYIFQFLNGAIKGAFLNVAQPDFVRFQFLNGAIKGLAKKCVQKSKGYFNSSMVRLKEFAEIAIWQTCDISIPQWCD